MNDEQAKALIVVGEVMGVLSRLDVSALASYLASPESSGLQYRDQCEAVIELKKKFFK